MFQWQWCTIKVNKLRHFVLKKNKQDFAAVEPEAVTTESLLRTHSFYNRVAEFVYSHLDQQVFVLLQRSPLQ
jgi:hypothetical protein